MQPQSRYQALWTCYVNVYIPSASPFNNVAGFYFSVPIDFRTSVVLGLMFAMLVRSSSISKLNYVYLTTDRTLIRNEEGPKGLAAPPYSSHGSSNFLTSNSG